jgi:very-short-patch-repair endonuclease
MLKQHPKTTRLSRSLRHRETWGERLMWSWLRDKRFSEYKFRRQHPIGRYYLDFFCIEASLNIELDGSQHGLPENQLADASRDAFLAAQGIKTLRFWNGRLRREKQTVRDTIWQTLQERAPHPLPNYCSPRVPSRKENQSL